MTILFQVYERRYFRKKDTAECVELNAKDLIKSYQIIETQNVMKLYVELTSAVWALSLWWRLADMGATQVLDIPSI